MDALPSAELAFSPVLPVAFRGPRAGAGAACAPRRLRARMSFADELCDALAARHGRGGVPRVRQSVRDTAAGHALETGAGTSAHRRATSHVAGLSSAPFWPASDLPWAARLEAAAKDIADELRDCSNATLAAGTNVWAGPARPEATAYGPDWRTLVLQDREWDPVNCEIFPNTAALLREEGPDAVPSVEAFFARQKPDTGIALHTDDCNFILTSHLALDVPDGASWIEVGGERRYWENGRLLTFDTSYFHRTMNESKTEDRTVLLLRFWHPELEAEERDALSFIFRAIENPSLLENPTVAASDSGVHSVSEREPPIPSRLSAPSGIPREKRRALRKSAKQKGSSQLKRRGGGGFG